MISDIVDEVEEKRQEDKDELFQRLIEERLEQSLKSYMHDLNIEARGYEDFGSFRSLSKLLK